MRAAGGRDLDPAARKRRHADGEKVVLKGVNLGAWMIWEDWLCPYEQASDHYEVLSILTERFGEEKAYQLMNTYMDNFITEWDLDQIKAMGFNCVRVPFWFRNFYYDDNGRKILDADKARLGRERLQGTRAVCDPRHARRRGLSV